MSGEEEMCGFEISAPKGSHAGKKEVGQKSRTALWCEGSWYIRCTSQDEQRPLTSEASVGESQKVPLCPLGLIVHVLEFNVQDRTISICPQHGSSLSPVCQTNADTSL